MRIIAIGVLAGLACMTLAGCHEKSIQDGAMVFSFKWWVPVLIVLGGIGACVAGVKMIKGPNRGRGFCFAIGGPLAALLVAPGLYLDRVVIDNEGFRSRHGFWWNPTIHDIRFSDLRQVQVEVEERRGKYGRKKYSYYFNCSFKSRAPERVPLGDNMREALPEILEHFRTRNIKLIIPPDLPD